MKKIILIIGLFLVNLHASAQDLYFTKSFEMGLSLIETHRVEAAFMVGFKSYDKLSKGDSFEVGYVFKKFVEQVGHNRNYNGVRIHGEILLSDVIGPYIQFDFMHGTRYMYTMQNLITPTLRKGFSGEGTIGMFYHQPDGPLGVYLGLTPYYYNPSKYILEGETPHKSLNFQFKLKYTLKPSNWR